MKTYTVFFLSVLASLFSSAQTITQECATAPSQGWANQLKQAMLHLPATSLKTATPVQIPYQVHLFMKADSTSNLSLQDIYHEIDTVNAFYANSNMFFYECAPPELIVDDSLYNYSSNTEEPILLNDHYTPYILNMYFPNTASVSNTMVCGYSKFPPSADLVVIASSCATNGSTLAHEIGHYFGLLHTHQVFGIGELVDGSNCSSDGDFICDTPADPTLSYTNVSASCTYTGTAVDANNMPYVPDITNIMSYSRKECRFYFSPTQYSVINNTMQTDRSYLFCSFGVGVKELISNAVVNLFPNPGCDELIISAEVPLTEASIKLYNTTGDLVFTGYFNGTNYKVDTTELPSGIYFYSLVTSSSASSGKWVKVK